MKVQPECEMFEVTFTDIDSNPHPSSPCIFASSELAWWISDILPTVEKALNAHYEGDVIIVGIKRLNMGFIVEELC